MHAEQVGDGDRLEVVKSFNLAQLANSLELIKVVILFQGGACVALLAFLAATLASGNKQSLMAAYAVMPPINSFAYGAFWSAMAMLAEIASKETAHAFFERSQLIGTYNRWLLAFAIVVRLSAAVAFAYCIGWAYQGLQQSNDAYTAIFVALHEATGQ